MTNQASAVSNMRGFTLVETIIYIGLFGLLFSGIFASMYPIFTNAEKLTKNIATEGEVAFILTKFHYALANALTDDSRTISTPSEGTTDDALVLMNGATELFRFEEDLSNVFCTPPRSCGFITYGENGDDPTPLNAERIYIKDFQVTHIAPSGDTPRYLDVSFTANEVEIGPIRYYVHF
jgi:type II secretory pathway pseudopilin PulG